jgi:hypothetical protein
MYVICATSFPNGTGQAVFATKDNSQATCTVVAPDAPDADSVAASMQLKSNTKSYIGKAMRITFIKTPVPTAISFRSALDIGEHIEVTLSESAGLHKVGT